LIWKMLYLISLAKKYILCVSTYLNQTLNLHNNCTCILLNLTGIFRLKMMYMYLKLHSGNVSQAILKKGGKSLEKEVNDKSKLIQTFYKILQYITQFM
jgi:hypothetical protein